MATLVTDWAKPAPFTSQRLSVYNLVLSRDMCRLLWDKNVTDTIPVLGSTWKTQTGSEFLVVIQMKRTNWKCLKLLKHTAFEPTQGTYINLWIMEHKEFMLELDTKLIDRDNPVLYDPHSISIRWRSYCTFLQHVFFCLFLQHYIHINNAHVGCWKRQRRNYKNSSKKLRN